MESFEETLLPMLRLHRGGERVPDLEISGVFLEHAFGVKLKSHDERSLRVIVGLNQAIIRMGHGAEARGKLANSLVVIAIHAQILAAIPVCERRAGDDGGWMAKRVVVLIIDMRTV